jgi:hypothetical protein
VTGWKPASLFVVPPLGGKKPKIPSKGGTTSERRKPPVLTGWKPVLLLGIFAMKIERLSRLFFRKSYLSWVYVFGAVENEVRKISAETQSATHRRLPVIWGKISSLLHI